MLQFVILLKYILIIKVLKSNKGLLTFKVDTDVVSTFLKPP